MGFMQEHLKYTQEKKNHECCTSQVKTDVDELVITDLEKTASYSGNEVKGTKRL